MQLPKITRGSAKKLFAILLVAASLTVYSCGDADDKDDAESTTTGATVDSPTIQTTPVATESTQKNTSDSLGDSDKGGQKPPPPTN